MKDYKKYQEKEKMAEKNLKESQEELIKKNRSLRVKIILLIIVLIFLLLALLDCKGFINISKFERDIGNLNNNTNGSHSTNPGKCPVISCDTGECCGHNSAGPGEIPSILYTLLVPDSCNCPSDTTYASTDTTSAGGPWKLCHCNNVAS